VVPPSFPAKSPPSLLWRLTFGSLGPGLETRPADDEYPAFRDHILFQHLTLQLISTLLPTENDDLIALTSETLSLILRLDPAIVLDSEAIDLAFYFFRNAPEVPNVAGLADTLGEWVLRKVWGVETVGGQVGWLGKAVELVRVAGERAKDDASILVRTPFADLG
jgi:hypothetical protein